MIIDGHCQGSSGSLNEYTLSTRRPANLATQLEAVGRPVGCCDPHPQLLFIIITQSWQLILILPSLAG